MQTIRRISAKAAHQICAGQVIVSLPMAVKELVENSLDAGATTIDVRLGGLGAEHIEVTDNGTGVAPEDYAQLAAKHATSKIGGLDDLQALSSLGFRGEALASLCAVAELLVTTATADQAPVGRRLEFDSDGALVSETAAARERGTTVRVQRLFAHLPVRLAELQRTARRQVARCVELLQAYALVLPHVRLQLWTSPPAGKAGGWTLALAVGGTPQSTQRDAVQALFGAAAGRALEPLEVAVEYQADQTETFLARWSGLVSVPTAGSGRPGPDRQFVAVNGRPVAFPRAARVFADVWRTIVPREQPQLFVELHVSRSAYDVNVTPDKRTILIHAEAALLEATRAALESLWARYLGRFAVHEISAGPLPLPLSGGSSSGGSSGNSGEPPSPAPAQTPRRQLGLSRFLCSPAGGAGPPPAPSPSGSLPVPRTAVQTPETHKVREARAEARREIAPAPQSKPRRNPLDADARRRNADDLAAAPLQTLIVPELGPEAALARLAKRQRRSSARQRPAVDAQFRTGVDSAPAAAESELQRFITKSEFCKMVLVGQFNLGFIVVLHRGHELFVIDQHASDEKFNYERISREHPVRVQRLLRPLPLELSAAEAHIVDENAPLLAANGFTVAPADALEPLPGRPLVRHVLKTVPVTKRGALGMDDFAELLQLLRDGGAAARPGGGGLSSAEAHHAVHDSLRQRLARCSRLKAMFASMACRCSIMIGMPLDRKTMRRVVDNLSTLEHPWNCPHGRPTMRHLVDVTSLGNLRR